MKFAVRDNWYTIGSLGLKFLSGALLVFVPNILLEASEFGEYAKQLSIIILLSYLFDYGISIKSLVIKRTESERLCKLFRAVIKRDSIILAAIAICVPFIDLIWIPCLLAAALGGNALSSQSLARASGNYAHEFAYNFAQIAFILMVLAFNAKLSFIKDFETAVIYIVLLPRIANIIITFALRLRFNDCQIITTTHPSPISSIKTIIAIIRTNMPYALQGLIMIGATNIDVLVASSIMSSSEVGQIKILTTIVGLFLVIPEMWANYNLNKVANSSAEQLFSTYWSLSLQRSLIALITGAIFLLILRPLLPSLSSEWWIVYVLSVIIGMRVMSIFSANIMTLMKQQSARVKVMGMVNIIYWLLVYILGKENGVQGFIMALLATALVQVIAYTLWAKINVK